MAKEYDQITAFHYAAFRPSLHLQILRECLEGEAEYGLGLDVGCGTGQSSIALANCCKRVIGLEPSEEMLDKSIEHPGVAYHHYDGRHFDFQQDSFDIITFAGSLYYAKSQQLLDEVIRVGKDACKIIIYDFEICLDPMLEKLNAYETSRPMATYDHEVNFNGLDQNSVQLEKELKKSLSMEISIGSIAHLLLSSKANYGLLSEVFGSDELYDKVTQKLHAISTSESTPVAAKTYSTVYKVVK